MSPGSSSHSWLGLKRRSSFSGAPSIWLIVAHATDSPATPALQLQQKDVVGVDMRPHAAAIAGVRDHQVVEPRIGHEAKRPQHLVRRLGEQVDALHQQRPALAAATAASCAATAVRVAPSSARRATHQARFDVGVSRQCEQLCTRQRQARWQPRRAHQQRLGLPVPAHELRRRQACEQPRRCMQIHAALSPAGPSALRDPVVRSLFDGDRRAVRRHADLGPARCAGRVDRRVEGAVGVLLWR